MFQVEVPGPWMENVHCFPSTMNQDEGWGTWGMLGPPAKLEETEA